MKKSLLPLKKRLIEKEEMLKKLHHLYPHLSHFTEKQLLHYFNVNALEELKTHIEQAILLLHARPKEVLKTCSCIDSSGQLKDLYMSEELAIQQRDKIEEEKRIQLNIYLCPYKCGWHLTKL